MNNLKYYPLYSLLILLCIAIAPAFAMEGNKSQSWSTRAFIDKHWNKKDLDEITQCVQQELADAPQEHKDAVVDFLVDSIELYARTENYPTGRAFLKGAILAGAQVNKEEENNINWGILRNPIQFNDIKFVRFLLEKKANPNAYCRVWYNSTLDYPLEFAKTYQMALLLINHGADPKKVDVKLIQTVVINNYDQSLISLYHDHGVDINGNSTWTPLHSIGHQLNHESNILFASRLLQLGARTDIKHEVHGTAAQNAYKHGNKRLGNLITYYPLRRDTTTFCSLLPHDIWVMVLSYIDVNEK